MSTTAENVVNQVEANKAVENVVLIDLTDAQAKALVSMDKASEKGSIAKSVFASRIKGMYKAYKDSAEKELSKMYDDASRRGAKFPKDKATFLKDEMATVNQLFNQL